MGILNPSKVALFVEIKADTGMLPGEKSVVDNVPNKPAVGTEIRPLASPTKDPPRIRIPVFELISIAYCGLEIPPIPRRFVLTLNVKAASPGKRD